LNPSIYIPMILLFFILFTQHRDQNTVITKKMLGRKTEDNSEMVELAKRFIDKACIVYTFNGNQLIGTIKEVSGGAILLENESGTVEAVNLDFVLRVREHPRKKNGKKKSVILD